MKEYKDYSLLANNTFGINVKAARFVEYESEDELIAVLHDIESKSENLFHIGGGSNLLFTKDFNGTVLHSLIKDVEIVEDEESYVDVKVGAGVKWDDFVAYSVNKGWYGAENLSYIPGEVGASAVQNIGAYGAEAKDIIHEVETIEMATGKKRIFKSKECDYSYRHSIFKGELKGKYVITHVVYRLGKDRKFDLDYGNVRAELEKEGCEVTLENVRKVIIQIRKTKLPDTKVMGNAGSFFMNPIVDETVFENIQKDYPTVPHYEVSESKVKIPAAWLIDKCGYKGFRTGHVGVHDIQPLVLVNCGGADANEIIDLASMIIEAVHNKFGITISPEVNYI